MGSLNISLRLTLSLPSFPLSDFFILLHSQPLTLDFSLFYPFPFLSILNFTIHPLRSFLLSSPSLISFLPFQPHFLSSQTSSPFFHPNLISFPPNLIFFPPSQPHSSLPPSFISFPPNHIFLSSFETSPSPLLPSIPSQPHLHYSSLSCSFFPPLSFSFPFRRFLRDVYGQDGELPVDCSSLVSWRLQAFIFM